jgi:hypothetical protein
MLSEIGQMPAQTAKSSPARTHAANTWAPALFAGFLLVGCASSPAWPKLASQAAALREVSPDTPRSSCEPPVAIGDWSYRVSCTDSDVFIRCGYHHATTCCWPVDTQEEATDTFAPNEHTKKNVVCEGSYASP